MSAIDLITEEEARAWLRRAVAAAGGVSHFAKRAGVSKGYVSRLMNSQETITGKVAAILGLRKVYRYELTMVVPGTLREQYKKQREAWKRIHPDVGREEIERAYENRQD